MKFKDLEIWLVTLELLLSVGSELGLRVGAAQVNAFQADFTPDNIPNMVMMHHLKDGSNPPKPESHGPDERRASSHNQASRKTKPSAVFGQIMQVFPVYKQERAKMARLFDLDSAELIYPASIETVKKIRRCVIGTRMKPNARPIVIKLEYDRDVRARYDARTRVISCGSASNAAPISDRNVMSVERYIANKMQSQPHFIKFYPQHSHRVRSERINELINVYVYDRINKTEDLLKWVKRKRTEKVANKSLERMLRFFFKQIHSALLALYKQDLVYTDFKPENVMISSNTAYLIDLESIVSKHSRYLCLYTAFYAPPAFDQSGQMLSRNGVVGGSGRAFFSAPDPALSHDRIMSWTFCFSIYVLICSDESEYASLNSKFQYWQPSVQLFMDNFGCKHGQISPSLTSLLNTCLVKIHDKFLFSGLRVHRWLK